LFMEDKFIAVYVMVRKDELKPEQGGSYDAALARQKAACLEFLKQKLGNADVDRIRTYTRRRDLFLDIERHRISGLVVESLDRLGSTQEEIDGIMFELKMEGIELMVLTEQRTVA
jgi:DNA invertase Pin-like site-specific DNA recombinase